jgi:Phosphotransferase enzyme family
MDLVEQCSCEIHRVIVLGRDGSDVLVTAGKTGFLLPSVEIPSQQRPAESLTATVRKNWNCEAICVFASGKVHQNNGSSGGHYQLMRCVQGSDQHVVNSTWKRIGSLSPAAFHDDADYLALQHCLGECESYTSDPAAPFAKPGWFLELQAWVDEMIRPLAIRLNGPFSQLNAAPSFSLIRFETTGSALWFKAAGPPNQHEFSITTALNRLFPSYLPTIIATRPEWRGWLMKDGGVSIAETIPTFDLWRKVAADLAWLQIESVGHSEELLRAGLRDLRTSRLMDLVDPFIYLMETLMRQQTKAVPTPLQSWELLALGLKLKQALNAVDQIGFPSTLGHSDFNPGNVLVSGNSSVFIDWAEAHVAHPFFTFEYLLSNLRSHCPDIASFEDLIRTSYAQVLKHIVPAQSIDQAFVYSPLLATFAYAVSLDCWASSKPQESLEIAYLRSLTRRMKREADMLEARRLPCLEF